MSKRTPSTDATPEPINEPVATEPAVLPVKRGFFFPNPGGEPFVVEAANRPEAEDAFATYLKTRKETP